MTKAQSLAEVTYNLSLDLQTVAFQLDVLREHMDSWFLEDRPVDTGKVAAALAMSVKALNQIADMLMEESDV